MKTKHSLASRLSLYILIAVLSLFLFFYSGISSFSTRLMYEEIESTAYKSLKTVTYTVEQILGNIETAAVNQAWHVAKRYEDKDYIERFTADYVQNSPLVIGSSVAYIKNYFDGQKYYAPYSYLDSTGTVKSFQMGSDDYDYFKMEWFDAPIRYNKSYWSDPYFDEGGGETYMTTYSMPIRDANGKTVAVFSTDVALSDITKEVSKTLEYEHSAIVILDKSGRFICHKDSSQLFVRTVFDVADENKSTEMAEIGENMLNGQSGIGTFYDKDNNQSFVIYGPISNDWSVGIICKYKDVFADINKLVLASILVIILAFLLIYFVSRKIIKRIIQPITEFTYTALNLAKGNFDVKVPAVKTHDELHRMQRALIYLRDSIKQYMSELQTSTASNERFESELNIARSIQLDMLSKDFPFSKTIDMFASLTPAREVGGDLYDFVLLDKNLYFCIGDVSGKGVPAALYMAITRAAFRFIAGMQLPVNEITAKINNACCDGNDLNMFVTMFVGKINLETGEMEYCNAGHNPIIIASPDGKAEYLHCKPNIAAGLLKDFEYAKESRFIQKGSRLLLYTDGITEAEASDQSQFGEDRLLEFVSGSSMATSSEQFIKDLLAKVSDFTGDNPQNDDITAMSIKLM